MSLKWLALPIGALLVILAAIGELSLSQYEEKALARRSGCEISEKFISDANAAGASAVEYCFRQSLVGLDRREVERRLASYEWIRNRTWFDYDLGSDGYYEYGTGVLGRLGIKHTLIVACDKRGRVTVVDQ